jgi:hypothetical protein
MEWTTLACVAMPVVPDGNEEALASAMPSPLALVKKVAGAGKPADPSIQPA